MNILFLTMATFSNVYEHSVYPDLIRCFSNHGHSVYVLLPNEKRNNKATFIQNEGNTYLVHVKTGNLFNVGMVEKLISRSGLSRKYKKAIKHELNDIKFDLVLYSTPPTTFFSVVEYIKKRDNAYSYLMLKDIFPQNAVDLKMIKKNGFIFRLLRIGEKKLYKVSDTIGCMSPANIDYLLNQDPWIKKNTVELCPNALEILSKKNYDYIEIRRKYGIPLDRTVFVYGGGLGKPQGIDFLISCIKKLRKDSACFFLVCGDGPFYESLKNLEKQLPNSVKILKWLPVDEYNAIVGSSDVGLVFLDYNFRIPNFPSRILLYMECGLPILSATDTSTDLGRISKEFGFGDWCPSKEGNEYSFLQKMQMFEDKTLRKEMGKKSFEYMKIHYNVESVYQTIISHFHDF